MTRPASMSRKTSPAVVLLAWALVAMPLGWGLYQSVMKSLPLFATPAAAP
jgi:hypothetical protein